VINNKGFTLIELIMVTIILGILAAVAIPRYMTTVAKAEEAVEDEVISSITSGLEMYATEKLIDNGRRSWPTNPFDVLETKPAGYNDADTDDADTDDEWTFNTTTKRITHQRQDGNRYYWTYDAGTNSDGGGSTLPPFNPPWNDGNTTNWNDWCNFELNEGCYACENMQGAGTYCIDQCAAFGCPGFSPVTNDDNNNAVGTGIGTRTLF
jgi:prepilin-type N-terminal cleavage/methylation domain-containing protein